MINPCKLVYQLGADGKKYGDTAGICRITGESAVGIPFAKWVKDTFTDIGSLYPGSIISNEAAFCFDESSEIVQAKTKKEKPQRFRTYSHIVVDNEWLCLTKADKRLMYDIIVNRKPQVVCLSESGQKHLLFKHRMGWWQLEDKFVQPNLIEFTSIHNLFSEMLQIGFSQTEIISGQYIQHRINKAGVSAWWDIEKKLRGKRGSAMFNFAAFLMFNPTKSETE